MTSSQNIVQVSAVGAMDMARQRFHASKQWRTGKATGMLPRCHYGFRHPMRLRASSVLRTDQHQRQSERTLPVAVADHMTHVLFTLLCCAAGMRCVPASAS
jgi:hypothetical protein